MKIDCAGCGHEEHDFLCSRIDVISVNRRTGAVEVHNRPACRDCIATTGILLPDRTTRRMVEQTVDRVADAALNHLMNGETA